MTSAPYSSPSTGSWFDRLPKPLLVDRYLARELALPFFFGVAAFSSLGISVGVLFEVVRQVVEAGLPLELALQVFLLRLPYFVALALPMSVLLASMMGYGRLANDSELVALRSCGLSVYRLVAPALVLSLVVTGVMFALNEAIVPAANYQAKEIIRSALGDDDGQPQVEQENIFYREFGDVTDSQGKTKNVLRRVFYAEHFDGKQMQGLTVIDRSQAGVGQIVSAKRAEWNASERVWNFFDGTIYLIAPDGSYKNILRFGEQRLQLPRAPLDLAQRKRNANEMNILEAQDYLALLRQSGERPEIVKMELRIQQKYALPFVCVAFGLVGSALGNRRHQRLGRATSFGVSVVIIFGYYLLGFVMDALGLKEILSPPVATWAPLLMVAGLGGVLLVRASR